MESQKFLANLSSIKNILAETGDIRVVLDIRDAAVAAHAYARAKSSDEVAQLAMDLKLRAERKAGGFLEELDLKAGRPKNTDKMSALSKLNISQQESSRWQRIANIPEERFEEFLMRATKRTQSALLTEAKNILFDEGIETLRKEIKSIIPPEGLYNVIVVDPPWPYGTIYDAERDRSKTPYPEMSIDEIKAIKLPTADDCILWLWTTNKFLHDAYHVLEVWGFEPKSVLTWVKDRMGLGRWLRGQTEHCILATKGSPAVTLTNQTTVLHARNRGHSIKPPEFYDFIETYCNGVNLDYFSRTPRDGWATFGTMEGTE